MKRAVSLALAAVMLLSLAACGGGKNKRAFEASKAAYDNVNAAYEITEEYGSDIYEAWRLGIYDKDEILKDGCSYLAKELHISEEEIVAGVAYSIAEASGESWDELSEDDKSSYGLGADYSFTVMKDSLFSWCVEVASNAYAANGEAEKVQGYLSEAKEQMKNLSDKYSDYEHYPALKGYFTTTSSFFGFCQDHTGSFEQLKTTIEDYKTSARDYKADLDYVFEE